VVALCACGGAGGGNPLNNPPLVGNSAGAAGQRLSFTFFQYCVNPIFDTPHSITLNGVPTENTCSSAGCHASATGRGGAFRVIAGLQPLDLSTSTTAQIRTSEIYQNFLSAQGETVVGNYAQSLLVNKPLVRNLLHGGGQTFIDDTDPNIRTIEYWIANPMPAGQDEFSPAGNNLFVNATPNASNCNSLP